MSPWGTPCSRFILSVRCPPNKICASLFLRNVLIQVTISGPKPRVVSVLYMKLCDMESKALRKSMSKIRADFFFEIVFLMRFIRLMMQLPMLFLFT